MSTNKFQLFPDKLLRRACRPGQNPSLLQRFLCWLLGCCN